MRRMEFLAPWHVPRAHKVPGRSAGVCRRRPGWTQRTRAPADLRPEPRPTARSAASPGTSASCLLQTNRLSLALDIYKSINKQPALSCVADANVLPKMSVLCTGLFGGNKVTPFGLTSFHMLSLRKKTPADSCP